jgi:hypothetical protein
MSYYNRSNSGLLELKYPVTFHGDLDNISNPEDHFSLKAWKDDNSFHTRSEEDASKDYLFMYQVDWTGVTRDMGVRVRKIYPQNIVSKMQDGY